MSVRSHRIVSDLKRGLGLLLAGRFSTLSEKLGRRVRQAPIRQLSASELWRRVEAIGPVDLYVDAGLGGGATHYLASDMAACIETGGRVVHIAVNGLSGGVVVKSDALGLHHQISPAYHDLFGDSRLPQLIKSLQVGTLVGFANPLQLMNALRSLMEAMCTASVITWHDHYLICPSHLLLDVSGRFCGVPAIKDCASCIATHPVSVDARVRREGLAVWREVCGRLLDSADEVRVFSQSSAQLLRAAYGSRFDRTMTCRPHDMSYFESRQVSTQSKALSSIAVIGRIAVHKGADVVTELATEIRARALPIKLVLIGTSEIRFDSNIVSVFGSYRTADLPAILGELDASLVLMPSIWPETFSYVAHEVVAMDVPLVTFPLGAQAECARQYAKGLVASSMQPALLLDEMLEFAAAGYGAHGV